MEFLVSSLVPVASTPQTLKLYSINCRNRNSIKTFFDSFPGRKQNIVIYTDFMSALQGLDNDPTSKEEFRNIILNTHEWMQWIPGHSNIPGNNIDSLAKTGSRQEQSHTHISKRNGWTNGQGVQQAESYSNIWQQPNDNFDKLTRKYQATILPLRTQQQPFEQNWSHCGKGMPAV